MNVNIIVPIVCILSLIVGPLIGILLFKIYNNKKEKKILDNAKEVLNGTRENKIIIDGEEYNANIFRLRDKDNKQILIDLKGGGTIQDGRRKENPERIEEVQEQKAEALGEMGSGDREKKRAVRTRPISRIRRFG